MIVLGYSALWEFARSMSPLQRPACRDARGLPVEGVRREHWFRSGDGTDDERKEGPRGGRRCNSRRRPGYLGEEFTGRTVGQKQCGTVVRERSLCVLWEFQPETPRGSAKS